MIAKNVMNSNPFVDVAAFLFLEDIADKQGEAGMSTYLLSLASSLATSMPEEEYDTWEDFLEALKTSQSILSTFEKIENPTDHCIVSTVCPFTRGILEYVKRVGEFAPAHFRVAEYYNSTVKPASISTACVICQQYRTMITKRIHVGGKKLKYAQVATTFYDGRTKKAPDEWLPILLEKAGITHTKLNMLLRNNACVWMLYPEDKSV